MRDQKKLRRKQRKQFGKKRKLQNKTPTYNYCPQRAKKMKEKNYLEGKEEVLDMEMVAANPPFQPDFEN